MTLCAARPWQCFPELTTYSHVPKATPISEQLRTKFFHGDFLPLVIQRSCTPICYQHKRTVVHVQSFLQDGLESGTTTPDKSSSGIPGSWPQLGCVLVQDERNQTTSEESLLDLEERLLVADKSEELQIIEEGSVLVKPRLGDQQAKSLVEIPAAKQIVELLTAWDSLSERLAPESVTSYGSQLLLAALKIAVPAFQRAPYSEDGRFQLSRALEVAYTLADLRMDAETIAAGILRVAVDTRSIVIGDVERELGTDTVHLLHDCLRVNQMPGRLDTLDNESASILREFSLAYHDVRAMVVELAIRIDGMRHIRSLPKHRQQILALENMQIYAPLAHALGLGNLSQELEDLAFRVLFPDSYDYVENWLQSHWGDGETIISESAKQLKDALENDSDLQGVADSVKVTGRCKSRFSTMKKLLKDGRRPDQVYDILGLRVVLFPKAGTEASEKEAGIKACYRAQSIVTNMWKEVPGRMKDYIAKPKQNGYASLHLTVYLTKYGHWNLPMELQIRTSAMDAHAVAGAASHSLYKGGLTDPQQVQHFKAVMLAAANAAAYRFEEVPEPGYNADHIFKMFDKNKDGIISSEEFQDVIVELGANKGDARAMMELVDSNTDGAVDAEELGEFQRQVRGLEALSGVDGAQLGWNKDMNKSGGYWDLKQFGKEQLPVF